MGCVCESFIILCSRLCVLEKFHDNLKLTNCKGLRGWRLSTPSGLSPASEHPSQWLGPVYVLSEGEGATGCKKPSTTPSRQQLIFFHNPKTKSSILTSVGIQLSTHLWLLGPISSVPPALGAAYKGGARLYSGPNFTDANNVLLQQESMCSNKS